MVELFILRSSQNGIIKKEEQDMATMIHFDEDDAFEEEDWETMGIGIGHREDPEEEPDGMTMGIGIGHRDWRKEKE